MSTTHLTNLTLHTMPARTNTDPSSPPGDINPQTLWGDAQASLKKRNRLGLKLAHKSLNIPWDDDMISVENKTGITWKEILAFAVALSGIGGLTIAGINAVKPNPIPSSLPAITTPLNQSPSEKGDAGELLPSKYNLDIRGG